MTQYQQPQAVSNQFSFTISEREYADTMLPHFRSKQTLTLIVILALLGSGITALGSVAVAVGTVVIFAAYIALLFAMIRQAMKKQYRSMPQLHGVQTVQFSEEGIVWHNDYTLSRIKWPLYQKFVASENMYLLYQAPHMFNIIPRSAFANAEQEAAFRMVLELHVKPAANASSRRRRREV